MSLHQPFTHDLVVALRAPVQVWSARSGEIDGSGLQGVYVGDHRVVRRLTLRLQGTDGPIERVPAAAAAAAVGGVAFHDVVRLQEDTPDPLAALVRRRTAAATGCTERIEISCSLSTPVNVRLTVAITPDATPLNLVKAGVAQPADVPVDGLGWNWGPGTSALVRAPDAETTATDDGFELCWRLQVPARGSVVVDWALDAEDTGLPFVAPTAEPLAVPALPGASDALARLVRRSVADLDALRLCERDDPGRMFFAAGAPWFLTLFGRDSLLAAHLALPVDTGMALATLRTLAARQGRVSDVDRAEQPGKILHEVRAEELELIDEDVVLPPEYYGTVDATPLWILLLAELVRTGVDPVEQGLFDALVSALRWLRDSSDPDGDGFAEYFDTSGHGLSNQGWKDSGDSVRFADGAVADGPIALAEVQGYCYAAAMAGADLLERFGRTDAETFQAAGWRSWAAALAERFRATFWVSDAHGRYPALALDAAKRPVDGVASNMGHLLGTGLLSADEEAVVVARLLSPQLFSGYGVRTMSTTNGAYWPTRYHVGSVWSHDTAVIIDGMLRAGFLAEAATLATGLLRAAEGFDFRLPELFGGQSADEVFPPVPYPASCRPQAWAAAAGIVVARALGALQR